MLSEKSKVEKGVLYITCYCAPEREEWGAIYMYTPAYKK